MILQEIEKQVQRWMDSKSDELKRQQKALDDEYREKLRDLQEAYRKKQEELDRHNAQYVAEASNIQQQIQASMKKSEEIVRGQKELQADCQRSLEEQERAFRKQDKDVRNNLSDFRDEVDQLRSTQKAGQILPIILSSIALVLALALAILGQIGVFPFGAGDQKQADELSTPTAIATEGPTEAPQEEPTPAPTPDPADAIAEVFPFLSREEFVEAEERLEVDGAECLRSYRMGEGTVYVNVFYGEDLDENLFADLCASYNRFMIEATPEPMPELTPETEEVETTETGDGAADAAAESEGGTPVEASAIETPAPTDETEAPEETEGTVDLEAEPVPDERTTTVLAGIRGEENYLCVFFARNDRAFDYRETIQHIETDMGISADAIMTYLSALPEDDALFASCRTTSGALIPVQGSLVPVATAEALEAFVRESELKATWMYAQQSDRFALYIYDTSFVASAFEEKIKAVRALCEPCQAYAGAKDPSNYALIFLNVEDNDKWFEEEPWFTDLTAAYGLQLVK